MRKEFPASSALFPMPVILIATYNEDGSIDVMNAAWGAAFDVKQVYLNLSFTHKTVENILRNKAFSIALADAKHVKEADFVGMVSGNNDKNKFAKTGLKAEKSEVVNAPVLVDFGVCLECSLLEANKDYGVFGEVKRLSVDEKYLDENGKVDISKLEIISYDPFNHGYYVIKEKVGNAFSDGKKLMK